MTEDVKKSADIVHMPGTVLSPEVVLHRALGDLDRVQAVALVILYKDGSADIDWSRMKVSELAYLSMAFDEDVRKTMNNANANVVDVKPKG